MAEGVRQQGGADPATALATGEAVGASTQTVQARWRPAWQVAKWVIGVGLGVLAFYAVDGKKGELNDITSYLSQLRWGWVIAAVAFEIVAILSFAALQRRLLASGDLPVGMGPLTLITLAGNAINNSLPGGTAFASVYAFRQYRIRGADDALAVWTVLATGIAAAVSLGVLAAIGLAISGSEGAQLNLVAEIILTMVVMLAVGLLAIVVLLRLRATRPALAWGVRTSQRFLRYPRGDADAITDHVIARLTAVRPSNADANLALGYAAGNWLFDCGCLACSFLAVGAGVPWKGLLLAYGAGQLAANLPITPGGLGVVEGSLTIALVAYGGAEASTVAAVLFYRLINFWASLPAGWLAFAGLGIQHRVARSDQEARDVQRQEVETR